MNTMTATTSRGKVHIRIKNAAEVYLVGRFNNWSTLATPMVHVGDWLWEVTVPEGSDLRELGFFVWDWGQRFGRYLRYDPAQGQRAGAA